jgi:predicted RNase H-like nuclease
MTDVAVLGVDGWRGGWVAAAADGDGVRFAAYDEFGAALAAPADVVAVDMPIGLPGDRRVRGCDKAAAGELKGSRSSVFHMPAPDVVEQAATGDHAALLAWMRERGMAPLVSAQAFGILRRVREVDRALRDAAPDVPAKVVEVHPEVCFRRLAPDVTFASKKTAVGAAQRLQVLRRRWPHLAATIATSARALDRVPLDDVLDAAVAAWTAELYRDGAATPISAPERDEVAGLPMQIVAPGGRPPGDLRAAATSAG